MSAWVSTTKLSCSNAGYRAKGGRQGGLSSRFSVSPPAFLIPPMPPGPSSSSVPAVFQRHPLARCKLIFGKQDPLLSSPCPLDFNSQLPRSKVEKQRLREGQR